MPQCLTNCNLKRCHQQKIQKVSHVWLFNDHNSVSRHDNKTNNPIFSSTLWVLPVYFSFLSFIPASQELQSSISWDLLFCIMLWSVNYSFACQICGHRYPLLTWSLLTLVHNQMYTTCSVPNLINIWPQSHELY